MTGAAAPDPGTAGAATLPRLFARWVAEYGAEPALSRREDGVFTAFTYEELDRRASVLALALARELGVRRGELVALICDNRPEWLVCSLAIHFLGAVDVPRATETPHDILEAILRHAEPAVVILEDPAQLALVREALPGLRAAVVIDAPGRTGRLRPRASRRLDPPAGARCYTLAELMALGEAAWPESAAEIERRRAEVSPEDLATIIYTSGTTGAPKGVALTHANYLLNLRELPSLLGIDREPVLTLLQPWHAYERQMQLMYLSKGCCLHYSRRPAPCAATCGGAPGRHGHRAGAVGQAVQGRLSQDRRPEAGAPAARALAGGALAHVREGAPAARWPRARAAASRPGRRAVAFAWALAKAAALAPFHALADRLVFREVRAGLGGRLRFPWSAAAPCPMRWTSSSTPPACPCWRATA